MILAIKDKKKINRVISNEEAKQTKVKLQTTDGKEFGDISLSAYGAIRGGYLSRYSPVDENEKKVLDKYKQSKFSNEIGKTTFEEIPRHQTKTENNKEFKGDSDSIYRKTSKSTFETMPKYQEAKQKHQKEKEDKLNAVYDKYGIDPNNFSYDDFSKWAEEHNFNRIPHNDPLEAGYDWLPNEKGVSKEVKKDKETLEQLALNNQRKNTAKEGGNAPDTFITSLMDGATLGGRSAIDNLKSQKNIKKQGLMSTIT